MESENKKVINKRKLLIIVLSILISTVIVTMISVFVIYPKICINNINKNYDLKQYEQVYQYESKLNMLKKYINNSDYNEIQYKVKMAKAIQYINSKEYDKAKIELEKVNNKDVDIKNKIDECNYNIASNYYNEANYEMALDLFKQINKKDDNINHKINECKSELGKKFFEETKYEDALNILTQIDNPDEIINAQINNCKYELGKIYIEKSMYNKAYDYLKSVTNKDDINNLLDTIHYNLSTELLNDKKYDKALEHISQVTNPNYENLAKTKQQIYYEYGKSYFSKGEYDLAISNFELASNYEDTKTYINNSNIAMAEELVKEYKFSEAKKIYDKVPNNAEYNNIKAAIRKEQITKATNIIKYMGTHEATKVYHESRNVWKYDGRWENWYINQPSSNEYIDIDFKLNDDGTFDFTGKAYFYAFNNFSTLSEYCKASLVSRSIAIYNVKSIPTSYDIDANTKLMFSNGKFSIKYSKKDDYSTSFYNLYNSSVTY